MKKLFDLILTIFLIFTLCACSAKPTSGQNEPSASSPAQTSAQSCNHDWAESTCLSARTCKLCGKTDGEPLGHTTTAGVCKRCDLPIGNCWVVGNYVDNFNDPTGKKYITNSQYYVGTFSNSATRNSLLKAKILVDNDGIYVLLYEYGTQLVSNSSSSYTEYGVAIKMGSTQGNFYGRMRPGSDRIELYGSNASHLERYLKAGKEVDIYIQYETYSSYLFTVPAMDPCNFTEAYQEVK